MRDRAIVEKMVAIEEKVRIGIATAWWHTFVRTRSRVIWYREEEQQRRKTKTILAVRGAWVDGEYSAKVFIKA